MKPSNNMQLDCYVDADFSGLWSYEDPHDPVCVLSRTGYIIRFCNVPVTCKSKLQTKNVLSTMEAEYVALSMAVRELLPLHELIIKVCGHNGLNMNEITNIYSTIWEENAGCVILANLELPRMTPRSKHYAVKYHWFRDKLSLNNIKVKKIKRDNQIADIFTTSLGTD